MPLYMDFHKIENLTIDAVLNAHMADMSIQDKYGVKYHQFWVNEKEGTVFCLTEGPNAETCELVHKLAHGNLACAITEVEPGFLNLFMGSKPTTEQGLTLTESGDVDDGFRSVLVASIRGVTTAQHSSDLQLLQIPFWAKECLNDNIKQRKGRIKTWDHDDTVIAMFNSPSDALQCATAIQKQFRDNANASQVVYKIGVSADQPVNREGEFFAKAIRDAHRLCTTANDNQILVSALASRLCQDVKIAEHVKFLDPLEQDFVFGLLDITETKFTESDFNVATICKDIGVSRPQLYRKITSLTGRAPNDFLRDLRLDRALSLLKQRTKSISQIAMEVGYSNPSYFSKCFSEKFGCMPSAVLASQKR